MRPDAPVTRRSFSEDGELMAYGLSQSGSDWVQVRERRVTDSTDLDDALDWVKFSGLSWTHDGAGFFYEVRAVSRGVGRWRAVALVLP